MIQQLSGMDRADGRRVCRVWLTQDTRAAVLAHALACVLFHSTPSSSYIICQAGGVKLATVR